MKILAFVLAFIGERLRGRPIVVDHNLPFSYLISTLWSYLVVYLRGLFVKPSVLIYGGVCIRARSKLRLGNGTVIKEGAYLDAMGLEGMFFGDRVSIGAFCRISVTGSLSSLGKGIWIGEDSAIGDFSHIGGAGGVVIGRDTIAGAYLSIHPENHNFADPHTPIRLQGVNRQGVEIGDNCWLGAKVTILDGTKIGNGCVVAAGAVVRGVFPDNVIIGGVPAKILRKRCE